MISEFDLCIDRTRSVINPKLPLGKRDGLFSKSEFLNQLAIAGKIVLLQVV